jgi:hypothetical protein
MIHKEGVKNRPRAVGITSKIFSKNYLIASAIKLNGKNYYDFKISVDILVKSQGVAGIAFRMKDQFNYYAFYVDKSSGWKTLVKVMDGVQTVLSKVRDGGILVNNWHRVEITATASNFKVFIYDLEQVNKTNSEKILEGVDSTFASGSVGLFVNTMEGFYFDNLQVTANRCWTPWTPTKGLTIGTPLSSVYFETFAGTVEEKFIPVDGEEMQDGPAEWKLNQFSDTGNLAGLNQNSLVFDKSATRRPSMLILRKKLMTNGAYTVSFFPSSSDGIVSIIFKYKKVKSPNGSSEMFYLFEMISSNDNSQFVLRRFLNGTIKELISIDKAVKGLLGYKSNMHHTVQVEVLGENIKIKMKIGASEFVELINVKDSTIASGHVGVGTFKVKCTFTSMELFPPSLQLTEADKNKILTTDNSEISFPEMKGLVAGSGSVSNSPSQNKNKTPTGMVSGLSSTSAKTENNIAVGWKTCINYSFVKDRNLYCERSFNVPVAQQKCKV